MSLQDWANSRPAQTGTTIDEWAKLGAPDFYDKYKKEEEERRKRKEEELKKGEDEKKKEGERKKADEQKEEEEEKKAGNFLQKAKQGIDRTIGNLADKSVKTVGELGEYLTAREEKKLVFPVGQNLSDQKTPISTAPRIKDLISDRDIAELRTAGRTLSEEDRKKMDEAPTTQTETVRPIKKDLQKILDNPWIGGQTEFSSSAIQKQMKFKQDESIQNTEQYLEGKIDKEEYWKRVHEIDKKYSRYAKEATEKGIMFAGTFVPGGKQSKGLKELLKLGDKNVMKIFLRGKVKTELLEETATAVLKKKTVREAEETIVKFSEKKATVVKPLQEGGVKIKPKERGFVTTVKESPKTKPEVVAGVKGEYTPIANPKTMASARKSIAKDLEGAVVRAKTETTVTKEIQAESVELIVELQEIGRHQDAIDIAEQAAKRATESGQASQVLSFYERLTPKGILRYAVSEVDKAKKLSPRKFGHLKITPDQSKELVRQAKKIEGLSGEAKRIATFKMLDEIGRLVPTPWAKKLTTLWKAGLLTGIKGAVGGNTVGNTTMAILKNVSDVPAAGIDNAIALATGNRGKVFTLRGIVSGFREGVLAGFRNLRKGVGAGELSTKLDYKKAYFSKSPLGKAAQAYTDTVFNFYSAAD